MSGVTEIDRVMKQYRLTGLTVWPTTSEHGDWQASLRNRDNSWRIAYGDTPTEAIENVIESYERGPADLFDDGTMKKVAEKADRKASKRQQRDLDLL